MTYENRKDETLHLGGPANESFQSSDTGYFFNYVFSFPCAYRALYFADGKNPFTWIERSFSAFVQAKHGTDAIFVQDDVYLA